MHLFMALTGYFPVPISPHSFIAGAFIMTIFLPKNDLIKVLQLSNPITGFFTISCIFFTTINLPNCLLKLIILW